jgi:hypothetical protein
MKCQCGNECHPCYQGRCEDCYADGMRASVGDRETTMASRLGEEMSKALPKMTTNKNKIRLERDG